MDSTIIAALLAFLTAVLLALWNSSLARKAEVDKELRSAVAELTKHMASGVQAMSWLTWNAKNNSDGITDEDISQYNETISMVYNELVGFRVVVAALSKRIHQNMTPLVRKLYTLDSQISKAAILFKSSPEDGIKALASFNDDISKFDHELLEAVTGLILSEKTKK